MNQSRSFSLVLALLLGGCAVGPDFHAPEAPQGKSFTSTELPAQTEASPVPGGQAQRFAPGQDIPSQWWTLFHSPKLDEVIRQALAGSPTLQAAEAALRQSQEDLNARTGSAFYPQIDAGGLVTRQKISGAAVGQPDLKTNAFTLYNASVNVSYALDVFGGARREIEALRAQVDFQRYRLHAAHLALTANIVTTAVLEASLRAQLQATREIVASQEQQLTVVERQFQAGAVPKTAVLLQQSQLAQTKANLPPLEKALSQSRHQLAVLTGRLPSEAASLPEFGLDSFELPQDLPVSLPSSVVRQRPDILAAESVLHAASAQVGVATANLYPRITLTGGYGSTAETTGALFSGGSAVWNLGAGLTQPLFHGGELKAKRRSAVAAFDGAAAGYRETVLTAFQNVADVLRALELDAQALKAQSDAESSARDTLEMARKQFAIGSTSHLAVLIAESRYDDARIGLAQAQALRFADTAALFQALGGGWWNEAKVAEGTAKVK